MKQPRMCPPELLVANLEGQTYVVTGASSGIGQVCATQLARQSGTVVLACRTLDAGQRACAEILTEFPAARVEAMRLDLGDLRSVERFAHDFSARHTKLHGLLNNAGVMNTPQGKTANGFELQLGINHLGHFHLTNELQPRLCATEGARVVNVSSCYHDIAMGRHGEVDLDDPHFERRKYDGWQAYAQSKLANVLHAKQLAKRLAPQGVVCVSVHPGWVRTRLIRNTLPIFLQNFVGFRLLLRWAGMIEPWQGAQSSLYALLAPEVGNHSGEFFSQLGKYRDEQCNGGGWPMRSPNPQATDDELAARFWELSERMVAACAAPASTTAQSPVVAAPALQ